VPRFKTMLFRLVSEETTRIALLRRGEVDVADVSRERVAELEKEGYPSTSERKKRFSACTGCCPVTDSPPPTSGCARP